MTVLTINGKLKSSLNDFKKSLFQLINYEPTLDSTDDFEFKCYIGIDSNDNYDVIDVVRFLVKHCSNFKMEIDGTIYYEGDRSPYFIRSIYYHWDGKNLKRCFTDYFGSLCVDVNFLLD